MAHQDVGLDGESAHVELVCLDSFVYGDLGGCGVLALQQYLGTDVVTIGLLGPLTDDGRGHAVGTIEAVLLDVAERKVVPQRAIVGGHFGGCLIVAYGLLEVVEVDVCESAQFVCAGEVGVAAYGLGAVKDCARVVIEVEFCNGPVEVGFVEVGLVVDDKVEVADG